MSASGAGPSEAAGSVRRDAAAIGLAVGAYGLSFGALAVTGGLTVLQACVLSLAAFTGASQFAFVAVVGGGGSALAGAGNGIVLGIRNGLYGVRLARTIEVRGWRRLLAALTVIDETTAMTTRWDEPATARRAFRLTSLWCYLAWNVATLIGALVAGHIGDPDRLGLDVAFPAAFVALLWTRLVGRGRGREAPEDAGARRGTVRLAAVVGAAVALATTPILPAGLPVLVGGLVAVAGALGLGRYRRGGDTGEGRP